MAKYRMFIFTRGTNTNGIVYNRLQANKHLQNGANVDDLYELTPVSTKEESVTTTKKVIV
jgi:hypothetical protein